jgi:segregation and condensation protein A
MTVRTLPWWRKALAFALDGIRSGFGLFRRNGNHEAGKDAALPAEAAAQSVAASRIEEEENKPEEPGEGSRVKPTSPQSEPAVAKGQESAACEPQQIASVAQEPAAEAEPAAVVEAPVQASEPAPQEATAAQMDPAPEEGADSPASSAVEPEPEPEQPIDAAPREEEAETVEVTAESMLEEAAVLKPEATEEEESISRQMEISAYQSEPEPEEKAAHEGAPAPDEAVETVESAAEAAPAPPEEIALTLPFAEKSGERTTAEKVAAALKARGEDADQSPFSVIVNQVYDGPLDLLLDLIRKQDIDIYDIPIARITAQFLAYVDRLRATDVDVAGEFIYTAALLIHIKSRMLLPRAPAGPDDTSEDPRRELVERLLEHERFKNAAQMLHEKQMLEAATWSNPGIREFKEDSEAEPEIAADTTDLVRVFSGILERARNRPILDVQEDSVTVGQMIQFLSRRLTMEDKPVALRRLLSHTNSERALIAMFLALLELVRLQAILLRQDRHFSEIFIKKHEGFESQMNQGLASARDDWR